MHQTTSEHSVDFNDAVDALLGIAENPAFPPLGPPFRGLPVWLGPKDDVETETPSAFHALAMRYAETAERLVVGAGSRMKLAVVSEPGRDIALALDHPLMSEAVEVAGGTEVDLLDQIVTIGEVDALLMDTEADLTLVLSDDIGEAMELLFPIHADGPASPLLPGLVRMAGSLVLSTASDIVDDIARITTKTRERIAADLSMDSIAFNAAFPCFPLLADALAKTSTLAGTGLNLPADRDMLANVIRAAVAEGFIQAGGKVAKPN